KRSYPFTHTPAEYSYHRRIRGSVSDLCFSRQKYKSRFHSRGTPTRNNPPGILVFLCPNTGGEQNYAVFGFLPYNVHKTDSLLLCRTYRILSWFPLVMPKGFYHAMDTCNTNQFTWSS